MLLEVDGPDGVSLTESSQRACKFPTEQLTVNSVVRKGKIAYKFNGIEEAYE